MKTLQELMSLIGRVAVVTGGAGHIGQAVCETLAEIGASVVIIDIDAAACNEVAKNVGKLFRVGTLSLPTDLSNEEQVASVPGKILGRFGRLDVVVNCAALVGTSTLKGWAVPFREQGSEAWHKALEINLTSPFFLVQACSDALAVSGHGSVINLGSIYGIMGPDNSLYEGTTMGNPAAYAASKGGLLQITRWLATVLAPRIRVNAISPGGVLRDQPEEFCARYVARTPLRRLAGEEDLKGAVAYLASDLSAYVTGHNLVVDGGWTVW